MNPSLKNLAFRQKSIQLTDFQILTYHGDHKTIRIQLIDAYYGLYVWTFLTQNNEIQNRYLMQDSRFSQLLPMIVCDCGDEKCVMEFDFDEPNFEELIGSK